MSLDEPRVVAKDRDGSQWIAVELNGTSLDLDGS